MAELKYTAVTLRSRTNEDGKPVVWKDVQIDTDTSFTRLKNRHFHRHGIDYESMYILDGNGETVYSHAGTEGWKSGVEEAQKRAEEAGYRDRKAGYYDKWYRYNHKDGGKAYDKGQQRAVEEGNVPEEIQFIGG